MALARALYKKPKLLILDEAFSALDTKTESKILKKINKKYKDITIINVAHKGNSLNFCDKVYLLKNNKLQKVKK